ncbi:MAG: NAD(P)-dependent oxidoreductase [Deltaproteobacteria bacterium]|nr:NAD(P)-dependent oxidoreductase [Deltaproteobacteria bacterium]
MKRIIVTGATGAIGTALIQEMLNHEIEVLVFCRKNSKRISQIPSHPLVTVKYCALDELGRIENDTNQKYDAFYHFAWEGTTGEARNDMYLQIQNVQYALDAVRAAKRFGCDMFIGAGSQAEYGRVNEALTPETPTFPENGYGMSKLCAGQMTKLDAHKLGMKHLWVRILSVYGINDNPKSMVMSAVIQLKTGITPQLTKGEQIWDFLFSRDAAAALRLLGEKGIDGKTYVLGSGNGRQLKEYVNIIRDQVAPNAVLNFGAIPYSQNQVMYLCADISQVTKDTGWIPQNSFESGTEEIIRTLMAKK